MRKVLLGVMACFFILCNASSQSVTMDDLLNLYSLSPKNIDNYLGKKGFVATNISPTDKPGSLTFVAKPNKKERDASSIDRSITLYQEDNIQYCLMNTTSQEEYEQGKEQLKKAGFVFDTSVLPTNKAKIYKKNNISVLALSEEDSVYKYSLLLRKKEILKPEQLRYAEDLLSFESHQNLVEFFGAENVKQDLYYFSEKELKKCSVLYPNSNQQVTFIWNNEAGMSNLAYILISGQSMNEDAVQFAAGTQQNRWMLKNGLYCNMNMKDLLEVNQADVEFYGRDSEFSYMLLPQTTGKINFKKTGITLGCFNCAGDELLNRSKVSAREAVNRNLTLYVVYIMLIP